MSLLFDFTFYEDLISYVFYSYKYRVQHAYIFGMTKGS